LRCGVEPRARDSSRTGARIASRTVALVSSPERQALDAANDAYVQRHPGERSERQPVQSFIEGAAGGN
jgi:hypothetical protein